MSSCQLGHSFSVSLCAFGSEIELGLKDHVAAAYYAPSIGWSFSLSHVSEALLGPPNQPPSQPTSSCCSSSSSSSSSYGVAFDTDTRHILSPPSLY